MAADLRRWVDWLEQLWECDAYDHGPFCRQCRPMCAVCDKAVPPLKLWQELIGGDLMFGHRECLDQGDHPGRAGESC